MNAIVDNIVYYTEKLFGALGKGIGDFPWTPLFAVLCPLVGVLSILAALFGLEEILRADESYWMTYAAVVVFFLCGAGMISYGGWCVWKIREDTKLIGDVVAEYGLKVGGR